MYYSFVAIASEPTLVDGTTILLDVGRNVFSSTVDGTIEAFTEKLSQQGIEVIACHRLDVFESPISRAHEKTEP